MVNHYVSWQYVPEGDFLVRIVPQYCPDASNLFNARSPARKRQAVTVVLCAGRCPRLRSGMLTCDIFRPVEMKARQLGVLVIFNTSARGRFEPYRHFVW